jgi:hypothetical protein
MNELLSRIGPDALVPLVALLGGAVVFIVWIIAHYWAKARHADLQASLKLELLRQGKTVDEIERILQVGIVPEDIPAEPASPGTSPPAIVDEVSLVRLLTQEGYGAEDIETLLHMYQEGSAAPEFRERDGKMIGELIRQGYGADDVARVVRATRTGAPVNAGRPV